MNTLDDRGQSSLLNDFLADLNKFVGQVEQTMHELQGRLGCPSTSPHYCSFTTNERPKAFR